MSRAVGFAACPARRGVVVTQKIAAVSARLDVVAADAVTARCTGDEMRVAVRLIADRAGVLMRRTQYVATRSTRFLVGVADESPAPVAGSE